MREHYGLLKGKERERRERREEVMEGNKHRLTELLKGKERKEGKRHGRR